MMSRFWGILFLGAVFLIPGCQRGDPHLEIVKEQVAAWEEIGQLLKTIQSQETMNQAEKVLDDRMKAFEKISSRAKALPSPSLETLQKIESEKSRMSSAIFRVRREVQRIQEMPGGKEFFQKYKDENSLFGP